MDQSQKIFCAISSLAFCLVFLVGMLVFGGAVSRPAVLGAALLAAISQFLVQEPKKARIADIIAMVGFGLATVALLLLVFGR